MRSVSIVGQIARDRRRSVAEQNECLSGGVDSGSQVGGPRHLASYARHHWAIENREHYVRDKTFSEDLQHARTGNQLSAYAAIRNLVIGASRRAGFANISRAPSLLQPRRPAHPRPLRIHLNGYQGHPVV